jgi:hypothetical protein
MKQCRAHKANGDPCSSPSVGKRGYCWAHDSDNAERRLRAASKGGKAKANSEVKVLREWLKDLTQQVIDGELATSRGSVVNQLIQTQIKLLEFERKAKETRELEEEIEALKREYDSA